MVNQWNGYYRFENLVEEVEADYAVYQSVKDDLMKVESLVDGFETYFQRKLMADSITNFNNFYDSLVEFLYYINHKAEQIEDYEFCSILQECIKHAEWKNNKLTEEFNKNVK